MLRSPRAALWIWPCWLLVALLAAPAVGLPFHGTLLPTVPAPVAGSSAPGRPAAGFGLSAPLPGSEPATEPRVDGPRLVAEASAHPAADGVRAPTRANATPAVRTPIPAASGTVAGRVEDNATSRAIAGASVTAISLVGAPCGGCSAVSSYSGLFNFTAPPGPLKLTVDADGYLENYTWVTAVANQTTSTGFIRMVHVGYAKGLVELDLPGHPAASGTTVQGFDRNGVVAGGLSALINSTGSFLVAVPPGQSMVVLSPPANTSGSDFEDNRTYLRVDSNATVDVGTLYIEGGSPATVQLRDSVNGSGSVFADVLTSVRLCNRYVNFCGAWRYPDRNGTVALAGVPGPSTLEAWATGYVLDSTPVLLPARALGSPFDLGTVRLVPVGGIRLQVGVTGDPPPSGAWPVGGGLLTLACTASGVSVGVDPQPGGFPPAVAPAQCLWGPSVRLGGAAVQVPAPPLRDIVYLVDCSARLGAAYFPFPLAPLPRLNAGGLNGPLGCPVAANTTPFWANASWGNVTPDRLTDVGFVNVTAGDYVTGLVNATGNSSADLSVSVCSTDTNQVCGYGGLNTTVNRVAGCLNASNAFCIASPPGPVRVNATWGVLTNGTWAEGASGCCAQDGHAVDVGTIALRAPALSPMGWLNGTVRVNVSGRLELPQGPVGIEACPLREVVVGGLSPCADFATNASSADFSLHLAQGWVQVNASSTGYGVNSTWVDLGAANTTGTVVLDPLVAVSGVIVDPSGNGLVVANVFACSLAVVVVVSSCSLSPVQTGTGGAFELQVASSSFPEGSTELFASAPGYQDNWTWFNATPGGTVDVGRLALSPSAAGPPGRAHPAAGSSYWLSGRVADSAAGWPLAGVDPVLCSLGSGCQPMTAFTSSGGEFNISLPGGVYDLYLNATAHYSVSLSVNLSGRSVDTGTLLATPYPTLAGQVVIEPWASLASSLAEGVPGAALLACPGGTGCTSGGSTDSAGRFNLTLPAGSQVDIRCLATPQQFAGVIGDGFAPNSTSVPISSGANTLGVPLGLAIDGSVSSVVLDSQSYNATLGGATRGALFPTLRVETNGNISKTGAFIAGGGGTFRLFIPQEYTSGRLYGSDRAFLTANESLPTGIPTGATQGVNPLTLWHFGWIDLWLREKGTGQPIAGASVRAELPDPKNGTLVQTWEGTNGDGFVNITAAPGVDNVSVQYHSTLLVNASVAVAALRTSFANLTNRTPLPLAGGLLVGTATVNTIGPPPWPSLHNALTGEPLRLASVAVVDANGTALSQWAKASRAGQFMGGATSSATVSFQVLDAAFSTPLRTVPVPSGAQGVWMPAILATPRAVLAGTVQAEPGNVSLPGLVVTACPTTAPACLNSVTTNGSGGFWILAGPGPTILSVQSDLYLANFTRVINASAGAFYQVGVLPVFGFGTLAGRVLALPTGAPVAGANVSLCSRFGSPAGPCFTWVSSNGTGDWAIPAPPSNYVLKVSAPFFNTTYLLVSVPAGTTRDIGAVFLEAYGALSGQVASAGGGQPLPGALLTACPQSASVACTTGVANGSSATFDFPAAPGPVVLSVDANGYLSRTLYVSVSPGLTLALGLVALYRLPPEVAVNLSGTVVDDASGRGISGSFVRAEANGSVYAAATSGPDGIFLLSVPWGLYTLIASAPGYSPAEVPADGHINATGLEIRLAQVQYTVSLRVTAADGTTGVSQVAVVLNGTVLGTTDDGGGAAFAEPNGSYSVELEPATTGPVRFANRSVPITVRGADLSTTVQLQYSGLPFRGQVVDSATGAGVAGVALQVSSAQLSDVPVAVGGNGSFQETLPPATYTVNVSAPGYLNASVSYALNAASPPLLVPLERPAASPSGPALVGPVQEALIAAVAAVAALWMVALGLGRARRAARVESPAEDLTYE